MPPSPTRYSRAGSRGIGASRRLATALGRALFFGELEFLVQELLDVSWQGAVLSAPAGFFWKSAPQTRYSLSLRFAYGAGSTHSNAREVGWRRIEPQARFRLEDPGCWVEQKSRVLLAPDRESKVLHVYAILPRGDAY